MVLSTPQTSRASRLPGPDRLLAALDIGGTKIAGAVLDARGTILHRAQHGTPPGGGPEEVFMAVRAVLEQLAALPQWGRVAGLGIASAGPVDIARGRVSPVNIAGWRDFPLVDRVRGLPQTAGLAVALCGDAVAMTAAEHRLGAARGCRDALCMVVSTGVGAGLVMDGAVRNGPTGNAGHLGHITVDLLGDPCVCGSRGCVEQLASGTALTRRALRDGWRPSGAPDGATLAADARAGDPVALAAFDTSARALAAAIAAVATLVEIEVAVIGGGVAEAHDVLFPPLRRHLASYAVLPFAAGVRVEVAALRADAGLIGAALIASDLHSVEAAR